MGIEKKIFEVTFNWRLVNIFPLKANSSPGWEFKLQVALLNYMKQSNISSK